MATTTADILVDTLIEWGVDRIFGMPGDGINGIMESLRKRSEEISFIAVRHEEAAAFMACGHAKFTGKLGVCLATTGPGGLHLLNGLYDAREDRQPVLAITGSQYHDLAETHGQQDIALDRVFADVAEYNCRISGPAHVQTAAAMACRNAVAKSGVSHLSFPVDVQDWEVDKDTLSSRNTGVFHSGLGFSPYKTMPDEASIAQAAKMLNESGKVALMVGRGALAAGEEVEALARKLDAPIIKALLGKGAVADAHPQVMGGIGLLGTSCSEYAIEHCDTFVMIGTSFPYIEYLPKPGTKRVIQIDRAPERIGLRCAVDIGLVGDAATTVRALSEKLDQKKSSSFLQSCMKEKQKWNEKLQKRSDRSDTPLKPQRVAAAIGKMADDTAIFSCDSGTITTWWARYIEARRGQMHTVSGNLASMGCVVPYAIAGALAYPERQHISICGDGGFSMLMADFATAVAYNLPIKVFVFSNKSLAQIKWEQMVFLGNPEYGCDLHEIDFAAFASSCGAHGMTLRDPAETERVVEEALASTEPVVIDCKVDPFEPPMPANISLQQALKFGKSLARGEPQPIKTALRPLKSIAREMI